MRPSHDDTTPLSPEDHRKLLEKLKRHALFLLARRDHTSLELSQKLSRKGYPEADIATVLTNLEQAGLINARRFTESYTHYRRGKGYGPRRIAMELQAKGVAEAMIAEQVKITDNTWFADIRTIWRKHFKGRLPADQQQRAKQLRFLYNRGFTQDQINSIFKNTDGQNEEYSD